MRIPVLVFIAILIANIVGCTPEKNETLLRRIDSLQVEIDSAFTSLSSIDSARISKLADSAKSNLDQVKKLIKDSLRRQDGFLVSDYKYINKSFQKYAEKNEELFEEINYTKKQLGNLYNDVKKSLVDSVKASGFYAQEEKATREIRENVRTFTELMNKKIQQYEQKNPEIKALIDSLGR